MAIIMLHVSKDVACNLYSRKIMKIKQYSNTENVIQWYKEDIMLRLTSLSSIEHMNTFAISGPSGNPFQLHELAGITSRQSEIADVLPLTLGVQKNLTFGRITYG